MIRARAVAGVGIATGHRRLRAARWRAPGAGLALAAEWPIAMPRLVEARSTVPGLRTVGFGDVAECPPEAKLTDLRIVA